MYLFCLAYWAKHNYFWDSSMLMQVPAFHFLLLLSSVLLYGYDGLFINLFVNIWVVSYLGLFQMKVSGIFMYKILFLYMLSFLLNKYLVTEHLDHMICVCFLLLRDRLTLFPPEWSHLSTFLPAVHECVSSFLLANTWNGQSFSFWPF